MIIDFEQIRSFVPGHVINEYGQLTGNYVRYDDVVCVCEDGRVQVWLDRDAYDRKDPDGLICDYDEALLRAAGWTIDESAGVRGADEPVGSSSPEERGGEPELRGESVTGPNGSEGER